MTLLFGRDGVIPQTHLLLSYPEFFKKRKVGTAQMSSSPVPPGG